MKYVYRILPCEFGKSLTRVTNKQLVVAKFKVGEVLSHNNKMCKVHLDEIIPITQMSESELKKMRHRFCDFSREEVSHIQINQVSNDIKVQGYNDYYTTFDLAKCAKLIDVNSIRQQFQDKIDELYVSMDRNIDKNFSKYLKEAKTELPELFL